VEEHLQHRDGEMGDCLGHHGLEPQPEDWHYDSELWWEDRHLIFTFEKEKDDDVELTFVEFFFWTCERFFA